MTDDELLAKAVIDLRAVESRRANAPESLSRVRVDQLPKHRIHDAAVIYFEGDASDGRIQVFMDRQTGEMISANYIPAK